MRVPPVLNQLEIREYRPGDEGELLAGFNRAFAAVDPAFAPRGLAEWRWRFLENPGGWRIFLALTPDGRVVSQYAGIGQRVLLDGEPARFSQSVDSFTDPAWRGGLKKPGVFVLTGLPFAERYGGRPPERDSAMWGLPVQPAWRIGQRYLGYELVRTQNQLVARAGELRPPSSSRVAVEEVASAPPGVDALSTEAAREHGAIAVRDAAHLAWRFFRNPAHRYRMAVAREGPTLRGYAVQRSGSFDGRRASLVCDWLAPGEDRAAAEALRAWLAERARSDGDAELLALFPDTAREWLEFQRAGFRVHATGYVLAARCYHRPLTAEWLRKRWYYTLGDTDLV
jgi:hypothetical protein